MFADTFVAETGTCAGFICRTYCESIAVSLCVEELVVNGT
jgi:hypothetical protein